MTMPLRRVLRQAVGCTLLILLATTSFLFSPSPQTETEYCGTYLHLSSFAGFTANCDGFVYMEDARQPIHLLEPREVRQSRPLFILLGTAVGYPCTWLVQGLTASGLLPPQTVAHLPAKYQPLLGFYIGYVLLNYVVLLASMLLFSNLYRRLTQGQGSQLVLGALLVFLASNQVTKAFFWTVHQQMFTFLVPLLCLYILLALRGRTTWLQLCCFALLGGGLALVYGSFVLVLPCLLYLAWQQGKKQPLYRKAFFTVGLTLLFALPTGLWIAILGLRGVRYYNHEAEAYNQLVWLLEAARLPWWAFWREVGTRLEHFVSTWPAIGLFVGVALVLAWQLARRGEFRNEPLPTILALLVGFAAFFAVLGYYRERLTFTLVPLLLCFVAAALYRLPAYPRVRWLAVAGALGWHIWQVCSYGPFS